MEEINRYNKKKQFFYLNKAARYWDEGLPLGNGRLGAMVMGKIDEETIIINEETIWYGENRNRKNPDTKEHLQEIRELLEAGEVPKAQFLAKMAMTSTPKYMNPYQPAGDLRLCFLDHKMPVSNYQRSLDLNQAVAVVSYEMDGNFYKREHFVSYDYQVFVVKLTCNNKRKLTVSANMSRKPFEENTKKLDKKTVCNYGQCGAKGISYFTGVRMAAVDGLVHTIGDFVYVEDASEVYIYVTCETDYENQAYREHVVALLDQAEDIGFEKIKEKHLERYQSLYGRMDLQLCANTLPDLPINELLTRVKEGDQTQINGITELLFHYARYLMISSSYGCKMPSNLQGLWNGDYAPPWQCEFTININTQMNYWIAEKCNLSECHTPLFEQLKRMVVTGKKTAQALYGCEGFCAHHNTNIWANTDPEGIFDASPFWPMGAAWLSLHLFEHYRYSKDIIFLKEEALPIMREAIRFFEGYLTKTKEGTYVTGPSVSPENTYRSFTGKKGALCMGPAMDIQILKQLIKDYLEGVSILQEGKDADVLPLEAKGKDADLLPIEIKIKDVDALPIEIKIKDADVLPIEIKIKDVDALPIEIKGKDADVLIIEEILKHLPEMNVTEDGRIMEWQEEYEETEPGHRHISHLFALHPGREIKEDSAYFVAAKKTLEHRLRHGGGHTGWSCAWIICFYARLKEGENVFKNIRSMLSTCIKDNLLDTHPPFQIDGNFGLAEGILESLAQSHSGYLEFLPALPKEWADGKVKGMVLEGGIVADFSWENGRLRTLALTSKQEEKVIIKIQNQYLEWELKKGIRREELLCQTKKCQRK